MAAVAVALDWATLLRLPCWTPLSRSQLSAVLVADTLFRLDATTYVIGVPHNRRLEVVAGERFITKVLWAASEGAARRAVLMEVEADDAAVAEPPEDLLPAADAPTYGAILAALRRTDTAIEESASYRLAKDGAFVDRRIVAESRSFHFRKRRHDDREPCYAMRASCRD